MLLQVLLNDVVVATDQVNALERDLRSVLIQLQNTIQSKTAVPTNQVLFLEPAPGYTEIYS